MAPKKHAQTSSALIISLHPAAAAREGYSPAAAPSSKIPTKQHRPHRPNPRTPKDLHRAAAAALTPALRPAEALEASAVPAAPHLPPRTVRRITASSL